MRRILVPLDGSSFSATVLDDARRLAGAQGELILMRLIPERGGLHAGDDEVAAQTMEAQQYLEGMATEVRSQGMSASTLVLPTRNIPLAIDEAATATWADIIACATHSQDAAGPVLRGSIAWRVLTHSPVPVLLRRPLPAQKQTMPAERRHILVPLDGSELAESALPLAVELADEWQALLSVVRVAHGPTGTAPPDDEEHQTAEAYLSALEASLPRAVGWRVVAGPTISALVRAITDQGVTDIVVASHGLSGLSRRVLGSVVYDLVHHVTVPTIVIPASARLNTDAPSTDGQT